MTNSFAQFDNWLNCLSGENAQDLLETESFLWVGTTGGLVKIDKNQSDATIFYNRANSPLPSNTVNYITRDSDNKIWGSATHIFSIEDDKWTSYPEVTGKPLIDKDGAVVVVNESKIFLWNGSGFDTIIKPDSIPTYLFSDAAINQINNDIWISSATFGLFNVVRYSNGTWTVCDSNNSILPWESPTGNKFSFDPNGDLWLSANGLFKLDDEEWTTPIDLDAFEFEGNITDVAHNDNGNLKLLENSFTSDLDHRIITINNGNISFERINLLTNNKVDLKTYPNFIEFSNDQNHLYVGFENRGLWSNQSLSWEKIATTNTIFSSNSLRIAEDLEENIYVTAYNGNHPNPHTFYKFEENEFQDKSFIYPFSDLITNNDIQFINGTNGEQWLLANRKLYQYNSGIWTDANFPDLIDDVDENNSIVHFDIYGDTWLFEQYNSYTFYKKDNEWTSYTWADHGARSGEYFSIIHHPVYNELWLSTYNGISTYNYDTQSWDLIEPREIGLSNNQTKLVVGKNDKVFGVSQNKFFEIVNRDSIKIIDTDPSLNLKVYNALYFDDDDDKIYVGYNRGVFIYDGIGFEFLNNSNSGITDERITSIIKDKNGNFWFAGIGGISIFNPDGEIIGFDQEIHTEVENLDKGLDFVIFPNPTSQEIQIKWDENANTSGIEIYTIDGKRIFYKNVSINENSIRVNHLTPGTYIIKTLSPDKRDSVKKLIIF